jgi:hypothetical protein
MEYGLMEEKFGLILRYVADASLNAGMRRAG